MNNEEIKKEVKVTKKHSSTAVKVANFRIKSWYVVSLMVYIVSVLLGIGLAYAVVRILMFYGLN